MKPYLKRKKIFYFQLERKNKPQANEKAEFF